MTYKSCRIESVWKKCVGSAICNGEYLIKIMAKSEDSMMSSEREIQILHHKLKSELLMLINNKKERLYLAYGMANIDIYKRNEKYEIEWSPNDGQDDIFVIEKNDFEKNFVDVC